MYHISYWINHFSQYQPSFYNNNKNNDLACSIPYVLVFHGQNHDDDQSCAIDGRYYVESSHRLDVKLNSTATMMGLNEGSKNSKDINVDYDPSSI
jgi:hypothetical protein